MIDIHHHLLFGLDDGSPDIETSVAMAEAAAADGITHVVCTPHANSHYAFQPEQNAERLAALQARVGGKLTLGLGCDFHLSYDNIEDALQHPQKYTINRKQYLLVEFADIMIPQTVAQTFYEMVVVGMHPIITHPERNPVIQRRPERLAEWLQSGCLVQVTAASLTGRFGKVAQSLSHRLLDKNWVHFIATDAHNLESRPPRMREAWEFLEKRHGRETAERLCIANPRAVFDGEELPQQPEALDLYAEMGSQKKSGLLARLFGR